MDYSKESIDRQAKIQALKDAGVIPYANSLTGKQDISEIRKDEDKVKDAGILMESWAVGDYKTAGRLISSRGMWKLLFSKLRDHSWDIQLCFQKWNVIFNTGREKVEALQLDWMEKSAFKVAEKFCQVWDYIAVEGDLFLTKHWELTLFVKEFQIMSKAVRPLPEKWNGLQDIEAIQRQRYLDMVMNDDTYEKFRKRSVFLKSIREYLDNNGFMEIDCPVLDNAASWAAAQPFMTHHNALDIDVYLRICDEIPLKKATAGRFEKVYEMSKVFRNEGIDPSHLQEFTMLEFQAAYWTLKQNMDFAEKFIKYLIAKLEIDPKVPVKDKNGNEKTVDFGADWQRVNYTQAVTEVSGIDISKYSEEDEAELRAAIKEKWHDWEWLDGQATATMIDYLYKKVLRPNIVGPAFIYNYPRTMQPLARQSDENPKIVEQYQVVVNGWEIIKCYSELIDPAIQKANFAAQSDALERGDEEATAGDDDYLLAMEHAFPPQSWFGMGIERIFALLMQEENLREVVMFPMMKPLGDDDSKKQKTMLATVIINKELGLEKWQELNTVAHLNASFAAREWKSLLMKDHVTTQDGQDIKLNIQHAIMIKESNSSAELLKLLNDAKSQGLVISEFTREMIETSDDKKVSDITASKDFSDIEHLGLLVFWERKHVDKLTKKFNLYS